MIEIVFPVHIGEFDPEEEICIIQPASDGKMISPKCVPMRKDRITILPFLLFFNLVLSPHSLSQSLQFVHERIEVRVQDDRCRLRGEYGFRNTTPNQLQRTVYYPFVVNTTLPFPDSILVDNTTYSMTIPFVTSGNGILFSITIPPETSLVFEVIYSQRTPAHIMEYILTTTEQWGKPLASAEYVVEMPMKFTMKHLSMKWDEEEHRDGDNIYIIHRDNFMPEHNLTVQWER